MKEKYWAYEDFKYVLDNQTIKSKSEIAHDLQRTKGSIGVVISVARVYRKNPNAKWFSRLTRSHLERYFNSNGNGIKPQVVALNTDTKIEPTDTRVEMSMVLGEKIATLDRTIETLKTQISDVIETAVSEKLAAERQQVEKELSELRQFKDTVRKDSIFVQLTKRLNNIV